MAEWWISLILNCNSDKMELYFFLFFFTGNQYMNLFKGEQDLFACF